MSIFGDFFSPSQDTQQQTTNTQNAAFNNQSNTQNNLWPYLQPYFHNYANTAFSPAPFNQYQTNAADRQDVATGNLIPGFNAAGNIATGGLSPTAYQPYMSQYTQAVVDPTVAEFERLNKSASSDINGSLAKSGSLGNTNNNMTRSNALAPVLNQQKAQIAGLYNQGYNQATNTALQSNQQQLGAASTLGSLTGAATGANTAGFNIGQTLWQDPLNWMTQGASGLSPFLQGAGTSSSSSGSSTGTSMGNSTGSTTYNPSTFQQLAGIAGLGASLFSDENVKENVREVGATFDGQPIYRFNYKGTPQTQIGLMAQDVEQTKPDAVGSFHGVKTVDYDKATDRSATKGHFAGGGSIAPFHSVDLPTKVAHAFTALHGIRERAKGGVIPSYDGGGTVGPWATTVSSFDPSGTSGEDIVNQAKSNQFGMDASKSGDAIMKYADMGDHSKDMSAANSAAAGALANSGAQLSSFMQRYSQPPQIQGYDGGGTVGAPWDVMPSFVGASASASPSSPSMWDSVVGGLKSSPLVSGNWTQGTGPAARALLAASGPRIGAPIAQQASEMVKEQLAQQNADRMHKQMMAQLTGIIDGQPTFAAQQATGAIDGKPTMDARRLAEETRMHNRPTWGVIGHDKFGQPVHGWINPNLAPNQGGSGASGGNSSMPSAGGAPAQRGDVPTSPTGGVKPPVDQRAAVVPGPTTNEVPWDTGLTGDAFLKTLDPSTAAMVKGIASGHDMPAGFGSRSPYWQRVMDMVYQYDPTFNRQDYLRRNATVKDFTSGKAAQNITSFNTALAHLDSLDKAATGLNNSNIPLGSIVRQVTNPAYAAISPDYEARYNSFNMAKTAVVDELTRAFRGTGGNVHDLVEWSKSLNSASSDQALHEAIKQGIHLLRGRIDSLGDQYARGMGKTVDPITLLSPKAQEAYDRLSGEEKSKTKGIDLPLRPESVPEGSAYSPSRKMWRAPDGTIYNQDGKRVD